MAIIVDYGQVFIDHWTDFKVCFVLLWNKFSKQLHESIKLSFRKNKIIEIISDIYQNTTLLRKIFAIN